MDIIQNLQLETRRLCSLGIVFRMYEHSNGEKVGIVVRDDDDTSTNKEKLEKAGYKHVGPAKKHNSQLYEISTDRLDKIHENMLQVLTLENNRLKLNGIEFYSYEVLASGSLVINIVDFPEIALKLTEMGYTYLKTLPDSKGIGSYVIPVAKLEEMYGIHIA